MKFFVFLFVSFFLTLTGFSKTRLSMSELIAQSKPTDWRSLDPAQTLYMELNTGRVVIELAPGFAPNHVDNVKKLTQEKYWDGLAIVRSQDNYVVQWAEPNSSDTAKKKTIKTGKATLDAEFDTPWDAKKSFVKLKDGDVYAPEVGFVDGFPAARDLKNKKGWLLHCYGAVGAGRDTASNSGGGTELYAVTGHAPRHLDRNVTLIGRVVSGIELLSSLPRGKAAMGFYDKSEQAIAIKTIQLASEVSEKNRTQLEVMKTDSKIFQDVIESRRNRPEEWFKYKADKIEICNVPIPVRTK